MEWTKSDAAECVEEQNTHPLLLGIQNATATLKDSLEVLYQSEQTLTTWSSNHLFSIIYSKNVDPKTKAHTKAHRYIFIAASLIVAKTRKHLV